MLKTAVTGPLVELVAYTENANGIAVGSARTCYAQEFQSPLSLGPKGDALAQSLRRRVGTTLVDTLIRTGCAPAGAAAISADVAPDWMALEEAVRKRRAGDEAIASSIYEAGHHTPFQHPTFVFRLEGISRHVVESYLHSHSFYNSEQQSQRYVSMDEPKYVTPAAILANPEALAVFDDAMRKAWRNYDYLKSLAIDAQEKVMLGIGKVKGLNEKEVRLEAEKKAQEMARYIIPIAAATQLYHTVSGIVLARYTFMRGRAECQSEFAAIVDGMLAAVQAVDPQFHARITQGQIPFHIEDSDTAAVASAPKPCSTLVASTEAGDAVAQRALGLVLGQSLPDLNAVMDPARNPAWNATLNAWDHSPALRSLKHVNLTFEKCISLTAFAQDQRHRMTPASRPLLAPVARSKAAYFEPDVFQGEVLEIYRAALQDMETTRHHLMHLGVSAEDAAYLLPNATLISFLQSGDLLGWIHKWRLRLCFNAQKEIYMRTLEEVRQAQARFPALLRFLGPPCSFIAAALPESDQDDVSKCCPEGKRWCGVKVWKNFDTAKGTPRRPF